MHDYDVVACTEHQKVERYVALLMPADERGRCLWGVWDRNALGWVATDGQAEAHALESGAKAWIARQKYLDETHLGGRP